MLPVRLIISLLNKLVLMALMALIAVYGGESAFFGTAPTLHVR